MTYQKLTLIITTIHYESKFQVLFVMKQYAYFSFFFFLFFVHHQTEIEKIGLPEPPWDWGPSQNFVERFAHCYHGKLTTTHDFENIICRISTFYPSLRHSKLLSSSSLTSSSKALNFIFTWEQLGDRWKVQGTKMQRRPDAQILWNVTGLRWFASNRHFLWGRMTWNFLFWSSSCLALLEVQFSSMSNSFVEYLTFCKESTFFSKKKERKKERKKKQT